MIMETEKKTDCYGLLPSGHETFNENGYSSVTNLTFFFCPFYISLARRGYHEILCQMLAEDKMHFFFLQ